MLSTALQSRTFSATDALRSAVLALQQAKVETASLDARLLLQHVLGIGCEQLLADRSISLTSGQYAVYQELVEKRSQRQPVAKLTGKRQFWDLTFKVSTATLDPRPDSEALIEAVMAKFRDHEAKLRILDMGTGTGCLLLTLLSIYPNAVGVGLDISDMALEVARDNAATLGLAQRSEFIQSCWGQEMLRDIQGQQMEPFDIVISNPPYIPTQTIDTLAPEVRCFEPLLALDGGKDGLDCYRAIIPQLARLLLKGGIAVMEIGMGQQRDVVSIATENGLQLAGVKDDLAGIPRCIMVTY